MPLELRELDGLPSGWAARGDVFAYFISDTKVRNPSAAQALIANVR